MITALPFHPSSPRTLLSPFGDTSTRPFRNFLIIAPAQPDAVAAFDPGPALITAIAHHLIDDGYVYVQRPEQQQVEDDQLGIRYLPLRETLPSFGMMTAVIVIGDSPWAARAGETYPDAQIFVLKEAIPAKVH